MIEREGLTSLCILLDGRADSGRLEAVLSAELEAIDEKDDRFPVGEGVIMNAGQHGTIVVELASCDVMLSEKSSKRLEREISREKELHGLSIPVDLSRNSTNPRGPFTNATRRPSKRSAGQGGTITSAPACLCRASS